MQPFSALAFKIMNDPFVGQLTFFRVYSGTLEAGATVYNATKGKRERIGRLLRMHANKREDIKEVDARQHRRRRRPARDHAPATRCATRRRPILLEQMEFPTPVISIAIEPKTQGRPGQARRRRWPSSPSRTRPSACTPTPRPARR